MKTTNYSELRGNLKSYLDGVVENNEPLVVSRPGAMSVVVLSLDDYNAIAETEYLLKDKQLMDDLIAAEDDIAYGRVTAQRDDESVEEFLDRLSCTD